MTLFIIAITSIFSIAAFGRNELLYKYQFNPYQIIKRKQYLRLLLHGFLHANWPHLLVNMIVLYSFGRSLELTYQQFFGTRGTIYFVLLYLAALLISPIYSLVKERNNYLYNAVGASGAVSAVVFSSIFFEPWDKIYFFGLLPIPGIVFAVLYLIYSWQMSKKSQDNIAHDTHFVGAIFGFVFPIILNPKLFSFFVEGISTIFH